MRRMKAYYITTAIWGNSIGYILFKLLGRHYDASYEWNKSIVTSMDNILIAILVIAAMGIPGAYYHIYEVINNNDSDIDYMKFIESVFFTACFAGVLGIPGIIIGRIN